MTERRVIVGSRVGLHARPASLVVQAASRQSVAVTIAKGGADPVDARSILSVIGLGAACGDQVILSADGEGAELALDELAALVASDLDSEAG